MPAARKCFAAGNACLILNLGNVLSPAGIACKNEKLATRTKINPSVQSNPSVANLFLAWIKCLRSPCNIHHLNPGDLTQVGKFQVRLLARHTDLPRMEHDH